MPQKSIDTKINHIFNTNVRHRSAIIGYGSQLISSDSALIDCIVHSTSNGSHRETATRYQLLMNLDLDSFAEVVDQCNRCHVQTACKRHYDTPSLGGCNRANQINWKERPMLDESNDRLELIYREFIHPLIKPWPQDSRIFFTCSQLCFTYEIHTFNFFSIRRLCQV